MSWLRKHFGSESLWNEHESYTHIDKLYLVQKWSQKFIEFTGSDVINSGNIQLHIDTFSHQKVLIFFSSNKIFMLDQSVLTCRLLVVIVRSLCKVERQRSICEEVCPDSSTPCPVITNCYYMLCIHRSDFVGGPVFLILKSMKRGIGSGNPRKFRKNFGNRALSQINIFNSEVRNMLFCTMGALGIAYVIGKKNIRPKK